MASERPTFPDDVVREILRRLPVKTLLRFKCVCKLWHSVISYPNFKLSTQNRRRAIAISYDEYTTFYHSINGDVSVEALYPNPITCYHSINHHTSRRVWFSNTSYERRLLGSCNGLLLISVDEHIFLWNPSTRYCQKVLELALLQCPKIVCCSGLCYDSSIDDYKALVLLNIFDGKILYVACLKTKKWAPIKFPFRSYSCFDGPVENERLHWSVAVKKGSSGTAIKIVYFDSSANKFEMLPMPDEVTCEEENKGIFVLGVLDECLCMIWGSRFSDNVEVLVMKQYDEKESWTRIVVLREIISPNSISYIFLKPLLFTKNRQVFLLGNWEGIFAYNVKEKTYKKIPIPFGSPFTFAEGTYVESLVSPIEYYWNDEEHKGMGMALIDWTLLAGEAAQGHRVIYIPLHESI